jgi:hypothetical protein
VSLTGRAADRSAVSVTGGVTKAVKPGIGTMTDGRAWTTYSSSAIWLTNSPRPICRRGSGATDVPQTGGRSLANHLH